MTTPLENPASGIGMARSGIVSLLFLLLLTSCSGGETTGTSFTVGLITNNSNGIRNITGFIDGMTTLGYAEGENINYIYAGKHVAAGELETAIQEMVDAGVDLIFTAGTPTGVAAHGVTANTGIPVVFGVIADPIRAGVLNDLTSPGGNMTGVKLGVDQSRRLELLLEVAPDTQRILIPFNPTDTAASTAVEQVMQLADDLGVELVLGPVTTNGEVETLIETISPDLDAIFLVPDSLVNSHLAQILAAASEYRLPTSGPSTAQVEEGALTSYGFVHHAAGVQAARIADRVLKGADPGNLPVEDTESFFAVNLETAAALGLEISDELLQQADVIIRPGQGE